MQRIIKNNEVIDETWHLLPKDASFDAIPNCDDLIVPLALWREHAHALKARDGGLGVWLDSDEEAEEIGEDVDNFQVIALNFPAFTDGRSYSNARLLRDRYRYKGELRAEGDVLVDQIAFMRRCGFDSFAPAKPLNQVAVAASLARYDHVYQRAADAGVPVWKLRHG